MKGKLQEGGFEMQDIAKMEAEKTYKYLGIKQQTIKQELTKESLFGIRRGQKFNLNSKNTC